MQYVGKKPSFIYINMNKLIKLFATGALLAAALAINVKAVPLTLNSPGVVGVWDYLSPEPANVPNELAAAQTLLDMLKSTGTFGVDLFVTSDTEYSGVLAGGLQTNTAISGYDWGFAKYNGKNAGYVLFYLGGAVASTIIPQYPADLWTTKSDQYAISHLTVFNASVPPPPPGDTVPDSGSTIALLGLTLAVFGFIARRK